MLMDTIVLLAVSVLVFTVVPLLIGSNAVYLFLTLCAGNLLALLTAKDLTQLAISVITINGPVYNYIQIALLLIAPLLVLIIFRKAIKSGGRLLQIVPALAAAYVCFMLVTSMLPTNLQNNIVASNLYGQIKPYYEFAVAAGLFVSVVYLWTKRPHNLKADKKHK